MCWAVRAAINILKLLNWIKLGRDYNHPYPFLLYLNQCMVDLKCESEKFGITINLLYRGYKKMWLGVCSISLAILIQQDLDYILLKTDIHSFVSNTETFLSDIWKPRYIFPKFKYQNWKCCFRSQFLETYDSTEILLFFKLLIYCLKI